MKSLSSDERATLRAQHKHERDGRIRDRIKGVLLYDKGWTFEQIAEALRISDQAVRNHIDDYQTSNKLKPENGGSAGKLDNQQTQTLLAHLQQHTYLYVKDIVAYVLSTFKIEYTVAGMHSWLKTHGFSYKNLFKIFLKGELQKLTLPCLGLCKAFFRSFSIAYDTSLTKQKSAQLPIF